MYAKKRTRVKRKVRRRTRRRKIFSGGNSPLTLIYFEDDQPDNCLESDYLQELFQRKFEWLKSSKPVPSGSHVLVYYQHVTPSSTIGSWIKKHSDCSIYILHLSDESCQSDISVYDNPGVRGVFRNYWRPECVSDKVLHLPLGYTKGKGGAPDLKPSSERPTLWSFAGATDRKDRKDTIESLKERYTNFTVHLTPGWGSDENLEKDAYLDMLRDSIFVPCLDGAINTETFRFYEALEAGAVPIICPDEQKSYENLLPGAPLVTVNSWSDPIEHDWDTVQKALQTWWIAYKSELSSQIAKKLG